MMPLQLGPQCCCSSHGSRVLIWLVDADTDDLDPPDKPFYTPLKTVYTDLGIPCDLVQDATLDFWTHDIHDYWLVFVDTSGHDPMWWKFVAGVNVAPWTPPWRGRMVIVGERSSIGLSNFFPWIGAPTGGDIGLTSLCGLTLNPQSDTTNVANAVTAALTAGVTQISFTITSWVDGGLDGLGFEFLFEVDSSTNKMVVHTLPAREHALGYKVDYVLTGDSNFLSNPDLNDGSFQNLRFAQNLWPGNVPIV